MWLLYGKELYKQLMASELGTLEDIHTYCTLFFKMLPSICVLLFIIYYTTKIDISLELINFFLHFIQNYNSI